MMFNKKGSTLGEQTMAFWTIFMILILLVGFSSGIIIYFGKGHEFRETEAGILNYKIRQCLFEEEQSLDVDGNFLSVCGLSKEILVDNYNSTRIAIRICDGICKDDNIIYQLGSNFASCEFTGKGEGYMQCSHESVSINGKVYDVIVGSNHQSRRN